MKHGRHRDQLTTRQPAWVVNSTLLDLLVEGGHVLVIKGHLSAHQHEKHDTETPDINLWASVGFRLEELRGGKVQTATVGLQFPVLVRREKVAEAEVNNLNVARLADEDVFNLQVPVDNAVSVAVVDGACNLAGEFPSLLFFKLSMRDDVVQHLTAINVFKQHVPVPSRSQVVPESADVLVVEQADDGSLARISVFPGSIRLLSLLPALATIVGRHSFNNLASNLLTSKRSKVR